MKLNNLILLFFTFVVVTSCTDSFFSNSKTVCISAPNALTIQVTDGQDVPVTGADLSIVNRRTGRVLCTAENGNVDEECAANLGETDFTTEGEYVVLSNINLKSARRPGDVEHLDVLEVAIQKDGALVNPKYIVELKFGGCTVDDLIGPRVVTLD